MTQQEPMSDPVDLEQRDLERLLADAPSGLGCPECGGSLWQVNSGGVNRYQCHVGHAFVAESLLKSQGEAIEQHLWIGLRLLREQVIVARQLAAEARLQKRSNQEIEQIEAQAQEALRQAELVRQVLLGSQVDGALVAGSIPPQSEPPSRERD